MQVRSAARCPVAVTLQPARGCGNAARVRAIALPQRASGAGFAATGKPSARSAPSGMQISLQTSQSARALSVTGPGTGERRRNRNVGQQQDFVFVAVVDQRAHRQRARWRPLHRAGGQPGGQLPVERGRQARVAGILPVRMPATVHLQPQRDRQLPARLQRRRGGNEFRLDVLGTHRRRGGNGSRRPRRRAMIQGSGARGSWTDARIGVAIRLWVANPGWGSPVR